MSSRHPPPAVPRPGPDEIAESLDRERRLDKLFTALSSLRVFLVLAVQCYLLLGFALIYVRPPSGAFYIAIVVLLINTMMCTGCLVRIFSIRRSVSQLRRTETPGNQPAPIPPKQPIPFTRAPEST